MAMSKGLMVPTVAVVVLATTVAASAFTLTNRDKIEHSFTIFEGDDGWSGDIAPGESISNFCASGCSLYLDSDEDGEADFRGNETVLIWDGKLIPTE